MSSSVFKLKLSVVYAKTFGFHHLLTKSFFVKDLCITEPEITTFTKLKAL